MVDRLEGAGNVGASVVPADAVVTDGAAPRLDESAGSDTAGHRTDIDTTEQTRRGRTRGTPGSHGVVQQLDGAFSGQTRRVKRTENRWQGPVVNINQLDEATEQRLLDNNDGKLVLASYGEFDPAKPPIILIHGMTGAPHDQKQLPERLRAQGYQVFVAAFDDMKTMASVSGQQLARAMVELRQNHYPPGTDLGIAAFCYGGVVAKCALNSLEDPGWLKETKESRALEGVAPRAGFGDINLRCVETAWTGYPSEPEWATGILAPIIKFFMWIAGLLGGFEMRATSDMYKHMWDTQLDGVDIQTMNVYQSSGPDKHPGPTDLDADQRRQMVQFINDGKVPSELRVRNIALGLRMDSRFEELQSRVRLAVAAGELSTSQPDSAWHFNEILLEVMPQAESDHKDAYVDTPSDRDATDWSVQAFAGMDPPQR